MDDQRKTCFESTLVSTMTCKMRQSSFNCSNSSTSMAIAIGNSTWTGSSSFRTGSLFAESEIMVTLQWFLSLIKSNTWKLTAKSCHLHEQRRVLLWQAISAFPQHCGHDDLCGKHADLTLFNKKKNGSIHWLIKQLSIIMEAQQHQFFADVKRRLSESTLLLLQSSSSPCTEKVGVWEVVWVGWQIMPLCQKCLT